MSLVVDADTHVIETEATWSYVEGERPQPFGGANAGASHWHYDGRLVRPTMANPARTGTAHPARTLLDLDGRLADMDKLGTDLQVIFSTFFISLPTRDADRSAQLCRSYNRWIAEICERSGGRLRFAAVLPLLDVQLALEELERARGDGTVGIHMRAIEDERVLTDPYFFPIYAAAEAAGIPVCIHSGNGNWYVSDAIYKDGLARGKLPVVAACAQLAASGVRERFPALKFAFIEAGASWLPYIVHDLNRRFEMGLTDQNEPAASFLADRNFYVTCQPGEDLGYLVQMFGSEHFIVGSDYGHADTGSELEAVGAVANDARLDADAREHIVSTNPLRLYGLESAT